LQGYGGGGSPQGPQQGPEYLGPGPSHNQGPSDGNGNGHDGNGNGHDSDTLAKYLETNLLVGKIYIYQTAIKFGVHYTQTSESFDPYTSRIARYYHKQYRGEFFRESQPQRTIINDELIQKFRDLKQNVPKDFR
jgi:hypothetical protein